MKIYKPDLKYQKKYHCEQLLIMMVSNIYSQNEDYNKIKDGQ